MLCRERFEPRLDRRIPVAHGPVDSDALVNLVEDFVELVGLRACDGFQRGLVAILVPDLVVVAPLAARPDRQDDEIEHEPPFEAILLDHAPVRQKFLEITAHRPVTGRVGRAEVDQQHTDPAAGCRNCRRTHGLRSSAISLPSFGSVPGVTSFTEPFSFVIDCKAAAIAAARAASAGAHSASNAIVSCSASRSTTRRTRLSSVCRAATSAICLGCTNMPFTLAVWAARPIHPLMRAFVRPHGETPGISAERSPVASRIIGESRLKDVTTTSPPSPSGTGSLVPGRTISTMTVSFTIIPSRDSL